MKNPIPIALFIASSVSICFANSPSPETLAENYLKALLGEDASALESSFVPLSKLDISSQDLSYIQGNWYKTSSDVPFRAIDEVIVEITPYDEKAPKVHEPWRWPIAPTHLVRFRLKKDASWNAVEAAVEIEGKYYLVRPLPPNE